MRPSELAYIKRYPPGSKSLISLTFLSLGMVLACRSLATDDVKNPEKSLKIKDLRENLTITIDKLQ